ncbi:hypothetical protein EVAR_47184_1 [Eumeta japonica]|uniref:Uncharacterized protein n=1 Tax=Eumeta variegata TaxID=151549 RepID=A0A4C1WTR4_EUMVA|nr:hypothetical protein EVAR_47184_1 [Eumeta japonica]
MNDSIEKRGKKVNVGKTKVMTFKRGESTTECDILIEGDKVEQVKEFIYLGNLFTNDDRTGGILTKQILRTRYRRAGMKRLIDVNEAREICKDRTTWKSIVSSYSSGKQAGSKAKKKPQVAQTTAEVACAGRGRRAEGAGEAKECGPARLVGRRRVALYILVRRSVTECDVTLIFRFVKENLSKSYGDLNISRESLAYKSSFVTKSTIGGIEPPSQFKRLTLCLREHVKPFLSKVVAPCATTIESSPQPVPGQGFKVQDIQ